MIVDLIELIGVDHIGFGSDLCQDQPDSIVEWMRYGSLSNSKNYGEVSKSKPEFPNQPEWFIDARGFSNLEKGLKKIGFNENEVNDILGNNWFNFYKGIN